jgi:predicted phage replisome organizer
MAEVKWIKITVAMFEDEKIKLIESMPEKDSILIIWIKLLAQAGKTNASGYLYLNENIPFTDEMLATIFNRPLNTVRMALEVFEKFGMIEIDNNQFISISNWEKHQNVDGLEKIREQERLRKQKQREKQKLLSVSRDSHGTVTLGHATDIDLEIDKEKDVGKSPTDAYLFFESNGFGTLGGHISQQMDKWLDEDDFDEPVEIVIKAMQEAVENGKKTWFYVQRVLNIWSEKKLRTIRDVLAYQAELMTKKKPEPKKPYQNDALEKIKEMEQNANRER